LIKQLKYRLLLLIIALIAENIHAQNILETKISIKFKSVPVHEALNKISEQTGYYFTYDGEVLEADKIISKNFKQISLKQCLDKILDDNSLEYQVFKNHIIIKRKNPAFIDSLLKDETIKTICLQAKLTDAETGEALAFASVSIKNTTIGTISNQDGIFILKIPKELIKNQICISYLGYNNLCIPTIKLYKNEKNIKLTRNYISLQEVIIRNRNPQKIINEAIKNIPKNYSEKPVYLTTFYREKVKQKNKFMFLSEAVLKIYKTAYTSQMNDLLKIVKSRTFRNVNEQDSVQLKIKSGLNTALLLDMVKNNADFINPEFLSVYSYQVSDIETYDNRSTYLIEFSPKQYEQDAIFQGEIYIDTDNKAFLGANYEICRDKLRKMNNRFIVKKEKGLNVRLKKAKYQVKYHYWNGTYYLKYVGAELNFRVKKKKKWFATNFTTILEMAVSNIDTINVRRFKRKETDKTHTVFADEIRDYDQQFWKGYNFIKPEDDWQEAIKKLQLKLDANKTDLFIP